MEDRKALAVVSFGVGALLALAVMKWREMGTTMEHTKEHQIVVEEFQTIIASLKVKLRELQLQKESLLIALSDVQDAADALAARHAEETQAMREALGAEEETKSRLQATIADLQSQISTSASLIATLESTYGSGSGGASVAGAPRTPRKGSATSASNGTATTSLTLQLPGGTDATTAPPSRASASPGSVTPPSATAAAAAAAAAAAGTASAVAGAAPAHGAGASMDTIAAVAMDLQAELRCADAAWDKALSAALDPYASPSTDKPAPAESDDSVLRRLSSLFF